MAVQTNADVAAKVRGIAAERRLSQLALAEALQVSPMAMSRRMTGATPFTPEELIRLASTFGTNVGGFFGEPIVERVA
jgi:transcriptional regulator with XRE-family HTH domain